MAQEFFSNPALGGDGKNYNTGGSNSDPNRRLDNYGWATWLIPLFNAIQGTAAFAQTASQNAINAPGTMATSVTSTAIGAGTHSITLNETGKAFGPGMWIVVAATGSPATNKMQGSVISHNSLTGALVFSVPSGGVFGAGTFTSWSISVSGPPATALTFDRVPRSSDTALAAGNQFNWIDATGTFTQTYESGATLGAGWMVYYRNAGTGIITHDPSGAETIDGVASFPMFPGEVRIIQWDGSVFRSFILQPFYMSRTTALSATTVPPGYRTIGYDLTGLGAGGGSGRRGASGSPRGGGAPGGAPARVRGEVPVTAGQALEITFGSAGAGGAAVTTNDTDGNAGTDGGDVALVIASGAITRTAYGGKGGAGGTTTEPATSGSGALGKGATAALGINLQGGLPSSGNFGGTTSGIDNIGLGGGGVTNSASGGNSEWGGAGSASGNLSGTTAVHGGSSIYGVPAGGLGAWITSSNTTPGALNAGSRGAYAAGSGAAGGTSGASPTAGTNGTAAAGDWEVGSSGGGGGAGTSTNPAGRGGLGAAPGGSGGGGGASVNGTNSGAGGDGAAGRAIIWGIA
jgi:hypothetical protein